MFRPTVLLSCLALLVASSRAEAASEPVRTDHLQSRLVADATAAVPGRTLTLGLLLEHDPHWHTYWRNPGDSGLATDLELVLPAGIVASPIAWPHPERFELAEIVNYGFGGRRLLPVAIAIPAGYAAPTLPVQAKASWLVCEEECIPGKAQYALELPVAATATPDARWSADFAAARADAPRPAATPLVLAQDGGDIVLSLPDPEATPTRWTWVPETPDIVANAAGPRWQRVGAGWEARWPKSGYFTALPADAAFVAIEEGLAGTSAWRFTATAAAPDAGGFGRESVLVFATGMLLLVVAMAFAIRASLRQRALSARSEETDR